METYVVVPTAASSGIRVGTNPTLTSRHLGVCVFDQVKADGSVVTKAFEVVKNGSRLDLYRRRQFVATIEPYTPPSVEEPAQ